MKVIENDFTICISTVTPLGSDKILVGYDSGIISLLKYSRPETLSHIQNYVGDQKKIVIIVTALKNKFISVNESSEIRVWEISSGICNMVLHGGNVHRIKSAVVLPNNLLAVAGSKPPAWECFDVWDLESHHLIHQCNALCRRPWGMLLRTTAEGFLVSYGECAGNISVWQIDRSECRLIRKGDPPLIYSMATLPTGEIVMGNHNLHFYKITHDEEIYESMTLINGSVINTIYPVSGYKLLVVDRSSFSSNTIKLWNYISENCEVLGNSRVGLEVSTDHIVLEKGAVLSLARNKLVIHEFSEDIFIFPKKLAEIRKNSRILSQAYRNGTSWFANLPEEILLKIVQLTYDGENTDEKIASKKIAKNYFCKPTQSLYFQQGTFEHKLFF